MADDSGCVTQPGGEREPGPANDWLGGRRFVICSDEVGGSQRVGRSHRVSQGGGGPMNRRDVFGVLGAPAVGVAAAGAARGQERKGDTGGDQHEQCAKDCFDCAQECEEGFHHCFAEVSKGKQDHAKAMHLCVDCAEVCVAAGKLVARMSPLMAAQCQACADCCEKCAAECAKLNEKQMQAAVESCRKCAKSCRDMAKAMGGK